MKLNFMIQEEIDIYSIDFKKKPDLYFVKNSFMKRKLSHKSYCLRFYRNFLRKQ